MQMLVKAALNEIMKAEKFLKVLLLVFLAMSWTVGGARRRLRRAHYRYRPSKIMKSIHHHRPNEMWPNCTGMSRDLASLVKSAIIGQLSKKLLQKCGFEEKLPQLDEWRETLDKKIDDHSVIGVIDWLYDEVQILPVTDDPLNLELSRIEDNEGPPAPEQCHDYREYVQIVEELGVNDDDWTF
ncbi:uncharacterized protein [Drosophila pseudoobscura]|uniref:Uncharacterized protein n=1 Tax=Drosophila pseudoobscura pseudoobscura TaxID=46245 RepID=A0A6I8V494_DROPS|nr:uncharacterized protein LOC6897636 [Drosophila pseudoobscura]